MLLKYYYQKIIIKIHIKGEKERERKGEIISFFD